MRIGGFRIQVAGAPAHRGGPALFRLPLGARGTGSAGATHLTWVLLDADPEPAVAAALEASIMDGSYWIPAPEVSKSLVDDHVFVKP
jgi:hypothetical protein